LSSSDGLFVHVLPDATVMSSSANRNEISRTLLDVSQLSSSGIENFRFGVGFNIRANTPYFPFTFNVGSSCFTLAAEAVAAAADALSSCAPELPLERRVDVVHEALAA